MAAATIRSLQANLEAKGATTFRRAIASSAAAMSTFTSNAGGMTAALASLPGPLKAVGVALGALTGARGLRGAAQAAIEFETATAELAKLLGSVEADAVAAEIRDLSTSLPVARDRLLDVAASAARLGVRGTKDIRTFTQVMAEVGIATDLSADQAATSMARLAKITQTPISEIRNLASVVNEASNTMAVSFSEVLDASLRAAPGLASVGATQGEIVALAASLAQVSASSQRAGTRLNRLASVIGNPDRAAAFGRALGISTQAFRAMVQESPADAIITLSRVMRQGGQSADILASELEETSLKVLRGLAQNLDEVVDAQGAMATAFEEGTSIGKEFAQFIGITESRFGQLNNIALEASTTIGTPLRQAINEAAAALIDVNEQTETFRILADVAGAAVQTIVSGFRLVGNVVEVVVAGALTAVFELFGQIARRINTLIRPLNRAAEIIGVDWRFALLDAEGALELADRGAQAIGKDLRDIVDTTTEAGRAWGEVLGIVDSTENATRETEKSTVGAATATREMATQAERAAESFARIGERALAGFEAQGPDFDFSQLMDIGAVARSAETSQAANRVRDAVGAIRRSVQTEAERIQTQIDTINQALKLNILSESDAEQLKARLRERLEGGLGDNLKEMSRFARRSAVSVGESIVQGIITGSGNLKDLLGRFLTNLASKFIVGQLTSALKISSPARALVPVGEGIVRGIIAGMDRTRGELARRAQEVADAAVPRTPEMSMSSGAASALSRGGVRSGGQGGPVVNNRTDIRVASLGPRDTFELLKRHQAQITGLVRQGIQQGM